MVLDAVGIGSLHADGDPWRGQSYCRMVAPHDANWKNYDVSVDLYNHVESGRSGVGLAGVMYNVDDENNYDYFLFALG